MQKVIIMLCSLCCCAYGMEQQSMSQQQKLNNAGLDRMVELDETEVMQREKESLDEVAPQTMGLSMVRNDSDSEKDEERGGRKFDYFIDSVLRHSIVLEDANAMLKLRVSQLEECLDERDQRIKKLDAQVKELEEQVAFLRSKTNLRDEMDQ